MNLIHRNKIYVCCMILFLMLGCLSSCIPVSNTARSAISTEYVDFIEEAEVSSGIKNEAEILSEDPLVDGTTTLPETEKDPITETITTTEPITTEIQTTIEILRSGSAGSDIEGKTITQTYILNMNTKKFHYTWCRSVKQMKESNKWELTCTRDEVTDKGYEACKICNP